MEQGSLEALNKNHWIEDIRTIEFSNTTDWKSDC